MHRPKYNPRPDDNHRIPLEYLRDRCGGFSVKRDGKTAAYTANYRGFRLVLFDLSKFGGVLTDWLIQCTDTNRFFWLECKTPEAFRLKEHDMTDGEKWLNGTVDNFLFCVKDEDMEFILWKLTQDEER